ncbi:MAG: ABC transporter permease [Treponema sp.]|jgi:putative ABC transport system permease protein|nr:ABC transporter permease [Treponema sp.]
MKKQQFYLKMVMSSLLRRRSRMIVALLAVAVGGTILSGMISIYYDIPRQMGQEFRSYGANLILVPAGDAEVLDLATVQEAIAAIPVGSLVGAAPYRYQMVKIHEQPFMAAGTALSEARKSSPYWLVQGRWPESVGEVLIGAEVAEYIRLIQGSEVTLTGTNGEGTSFSRDFTVSGIVQTGGTEEAFIFMALEAFEEMIGKGGTADVVECSVAVSGEALQGMAKELSRYPGVEARLVKRVTESEGTVLSKLKALVYLVTVIVLLLTMICVATTMMAVVTERRKEIGLRKALGAANGSLITEFLGEGIFLGGVGGCLGVLWGAFFAQAVAFNVFSRPVRFFPLLIPLTIIPSILITALACIIPVRSATEVDPAIVLRGE